MSNEYSGSYSDSGAMYRGTKRWQSIPVAIVEDPRLGHVAARIALWLGTRPDKWVFIVGFMRAQLGVSKRDWKQARRELERAGYLLVERKRAEHGDVYLAGPRKGEQIKPGTWMPETFEFVEEPAGTSSSPAAQGDGKSPGCRSPQVDSPALDSPSLDSPVPDSPVMERWPTNKGIGINNQNQGIKKTNHQPPRASAGGLAPRAQAGGGLELDGSTPTPTPTVGDGGGGAIYIDAVVRAVPTIDQAARRRILSALGSATLDQQKIAAVSLLQQLPRVRLSAIGLAYRLAEAAAAGTLVASPQPQPQPSAQAASPAASRAEDLDEVVVRLARACGARVGSVVTGPGLSQMRRAVVVDSYGGLCQDSRDGPRLSTGHAARIWQAVKDSKLSLTSPSA